MENTNEMELIFDSRSANESFARVTVASFMTSLNPTLEKSVGCENGSFRSCDKCHYTWI